MKFFILVMLLTLVLNSAHSVPTDNDYPEEPLDYESSESRARPRRVTCDLVNYGGKVGHSVCAGSCLSMGKAGGRCHKGVCQCRRTTYQDFKDKRFG